MATEGSWESLNDGSGGWRAPVYEDMGLGEVLIGYKYYDKDRNYTGWVPTEQGASFPTAPNTPTSTKPTAPETGASPGRTEAKNTYLEWVDWKRRELSNLINKYKTEYPKQISAFETAALGALPEKEKDMWSEMYSSLDQRGLSDSGSFLGGAKSDLAQWKAGEESYIEDTKQGMEATAQQAILSALGQPDYGSIYGSWIDIDNQIAAYNQREYDKWLQEGGGGTAPTEIVGTPRPK